MRYSVVVANQPVRDVLLAMARETKINFDIQPGHRGHRHAERDRPDAQADPHAHGAARWTCAGSWTARPSAVMPDTPVPAQLPRRLREHDARRERDRRHRDAGDLRDGRTGASGGAGAGLRQQLHAHRQQRVARTASGRRSRRTSRTCCARPTSCCPRAAARPSCRDARPVGARPPASAHAEPARSTRRAPRGAGTSHGRSPAPTEATQAGGIHRAEAHLPRSRLGDRQSRDRHRDRCAPPRASTRRCGSSSTASRPAAKRQVLIEATIVEVALNDNYQSGVDWSSLALNGLGYSFTPDLRVGVERRDPRSRAVLLRDLQQPQRGRRRLDQQRREAARHVRQDARAVEPEADGAQQPDRDAQGGRQPRLLHGQGRHRRPTSRPSTTTFTTTQNVVPVGFIMNVTPQISEGDMVTLNVRPTVTRIIDFVNDPNPSLAAANVVSNDPGDADARDGERAQGGERPDRGPGRADARQLRGLDRRAADRLAHPAAWRPRELPQRQREEDASS